MRYWKRVDKDGNTTTVESYSHDLDIEGAIEISQTEHDQFTASLPEPGLKPSRLDLLEARVDAIEAQIPFMSE